MSTEIEAKGGSGAPPLGSRRSGVGAASTNMERWRKTQEAREAAAWALWFLVLCAVCGLTLYCDGR